MRYKISFLFSIFFCIASLAQETLYFETFDVKSGLPESFVIDIKQDKFGYIWMATQRGVVRYDGYNYKVYLLEHPENPRGVSNAASLYVDSKMNIWVGTLFNGIYKYEHATDTYRRIPYPGNVTENHSALIMADDNEGNIWGTWETPEARNSVWKLSPDGKFESFGSLEKGKNLIDAMSFYDIKVLSNGRVWIATSNGLYRYEGPNKNFTGFYNNQSTPSQWYNLYESPNEPGLFWSYQGEGDLSKVNIARFNTMNAKVDFIAFLDKGVAEVKSKDVQARDLTILLSKSMIEDKGKTLWATCTNGLFEYNDGRFVTYNPESTTEVLSSFVYSILPYNENEFLLTSDDGGLLRFDKKAKKFHVYKADKLAPGSINSNRIYAKFIDSQNNIWLGHPWGGGSKSNKSKSAFDIRKLPIQTKKLNFSTTFNDECWIAADNGIYKLNLADNTTEKVVSNGNEEFFKVIARPEGFYYISSKGLSMSPHSGGLTRLLVPAHEGDRFLQIYIDSENIIWLVNSEKGVCTYDLKTRDFVRHPYRKGTEKITAANANYLDDDRAVSIYEDKNGTIWIGTNWGGINKFDRKTQTFTSSKLDDHNKNMECITSMLEDKDGRFWVSTYQDGVFEFDRKTGKWVKHIHEKTGLIFNGVHNVVQDQQGLLWLISERGLSKLDPKSGAIRNYPLNTFMPGYDIDGTQKSIPVFSNGKMLINLGTAYAVFDPSLLSGDKNPPKVIIEKLAFSDPNAEHASVSEIILSDQKLIRLKHNQNRIRFDYIGLHFENPAENQYAYKLEGYDNDWVQAGTQRNVTYTNLPPGEYSFRIKASNSDGVWSDDKTSIQIIISPPWWATWWAYLIYAIVVAAIIWFVIVWRSRALKRENRILEEKIAIRTNQLTKSIENLKTTQSQLIQSEKMASLGELTAGIAHEIQNPLNFVNNFSDVSIELLEEIEVESRKSNVERNYDLISEIHQDIKQNLEKIAHHGRRADSIVKGMLQHSRKSAGEKELTDLNALTDEFLRLAYHGLRAKDKSFNATLKTDFDQNLPKISVIPQDIGRVLLNLFTNAFYATQERSKSEDRTYKPKVEVMTLINENNIEIHITDNGSGIPSHIIDKIFQPFFTTKPTGQGTGLGLSLAYDIMKAHGGELKVETEAAKFTKFTLSFPS